MTQLAMTPVGRVRMNPATPLVPFRRAIITAALLLLAGLAPAAELTVQRLFAAPDLAGDSLRSPRISPDGRMVAYLKVRPMTVTGWTCGPMTWRTARIAS
jgi:hypothetical protein